MIVHIRNSVGPGGGALLHSRLPLDGSFCSAPFSFRDAIIQVLSFKSAGQEVLRWRQYVADDCCVRVATWLDQKLVIILSICCIVLICWFYDVVR